MNSVAVADIDADWPSHGARSGVATWADRGFKPILAVTGLAMEARIAAGPGVDVVCSACDPARLRALLQLLNPERYSAVVSFGISGALDPALRPGDVVVAAEIRSETDTLPLAPGLARALTDRLGRTGKTPLCATIAGINAPVMEAATKASLWRTTGAVAVDMESHVAASFAAAAGIPVCAVRVISDPAERSLPQLSLCAMRPDGRLDLPAICASVARNPGQIPLLIKAGRDARIAFATLRRVRSHLDLGAGFNGAHLR
jgi:hopanoid-associated phosphorylase